MAALSAPGLSGALILEAVDPDRRVPYVVSAEFDTAPIVPLPASGLLLATLTGACAAAARRRRPRPA